MLNYQGWIVQETEQRTVDFDAVNVDSFYVEYTENGERKRHFIGDGVRGSIAAVEWWDKRAGKPIQLDPILKGCFRVYTIAGE